MTMLKVSKLRRDCPGMMVGAVVSGLKAIRRSCESGKLCPQGFRFLPAPERREKGVCRYFPLTPGVSALRKKAILMNKSPN